MTVAETILQQLGGHRFRAMTGAHSFTSDRDTLVFKIPRAKSGIKAVRITLDPSDTYTVTFFKQARAPSFKVTVVKEIDGVYADQLRDVFTEATGLYTSLGTMGRDRSRRDPKRERELRSSLTPIHEEARRYVREGDYAFAIMTYEKAARQTRGRKRELLLEAAADLKKRVGWRDQRRSPARSRARDDSSRHTVEHRGMVHGSYAKLSAAITRARELSKSTSVGEAIVVRAPAVESASRRTGKIVYTAYGRLR